MEGNSFNFYMEVIKLIFSYFRKGQQSAFQGESLDSCFPVL